MSNERTTYIVLTFTASGGQFESHEGINSSAEALTIARDMLFCYERDGYPGKFYAEILVQTRAVLTSVSMHEKVAT